METETEPQGRHSGTDSFLYEKNDEFTGFVEGVGTNGEGIIRIGETVYFAPFTVVGEKVKLKTLKRKGNIGYAKAVEILTPADERVRPQCRQYTKCGGCQLQHLRYGAQLKFKSKNVAESLRKIAGIEYRVPLAVKSEHQYGYRNKLQLPVGVGKDGRNIIGFYAERTHRIVPIDACPIHPDWAKDIIAVFYDFMKQTGLRGYDEKTRRGDIRHIVVREVEGCFIITAVTARDVLPQADLLVRLISKKFKVFSLWQNVNIGNGNPVFGETFRCLYGEGKYKAHECGIKYIVGPQTFVQVNRNVCRKLYERITRYAALSKATVAVDCYSGGGMLTAMLAKQLSKAYGIECEREASQCADELVALNKLEGRMVNLCGKVEDLLPDLLGKINPADVFLVVDPPRKGIDRGTLKAILDTGIRHMAMISCNPATMARDVGFLTGTLTEDENGALKKNTSDSSFGGTYFNLSYIQPFDMFPQTKHIEILVILDR